MDNYFRNVSMVKEFLVKPNRSVYLVQGKISLPNYPQYFVLKVYNSNIMPTEVEIHLELSKSDNSILQVYDHWPENNYYYMSIEYCENGDLHSYLEIVKGQPIGLQLVLFTASQLAFTLSSMHKLLICHRDIKPLNIYMKAERTVFKLADFGEAKKVHTNALGYNTMTGTPYYMSPEQKGNFFSGLNEQVNPYRDDIWALGRTFLEISFARLCPETLKMDVPTLHVFIDRGFERLGYSYEFRDLIKRMMTQIENFNITADVVLFEINSLYNKLFVPGNNYLSNSMNLNSSGSNFSYDVPDLNGFTSVAGNNLKVPPFHVSKGPDLPGKDPSFVSIIPSPLNSRIVSEPPAFNPYQLTIPPPILQGKNDGNNFYNHPQVPNNDLNQIPAYPPGPSKFSILPSNDKPPDLNSSYLPASMPQNALPDNIGPQKVFSPKIAKVPQFPDVSNLHKVADYPYQINVPKQSDLSNFPPALQNLHLSKVVGIHDKNNQSNLPPNVPPLVQNILNVPNVPKAPGTPNMQVPNNLPPNVPNIPKVPSTPNMQVPNNLPLNVPPVFQNMQNVGNIHKPPDFPNTQNALNLIPSVPPENVPKIPNSPGILNVSSFSKLPNSEAAGLKHSSGTSSVPDLSGSSKALIMPKLPHDLNPHIFPRESCSPESQNYSKNFSKVPDLPQKKTGNYFNDGGSSGINPNIRNSLNQPPPELPIKEPASKPPGIFKSGLENLIPGLPNQPMQEKPFNLSGSLENQYPNLPPPPGQPIFSNPIQSRPSTAAGIESSSPNNPIYPMVAGLPSINLSQGLINGNNYQISSKDLKVVKPEVLNYPNINKIEKNNEVKVFPARPESGLFRGKAPEPHFKSFAQQNYSGKRNSVTPFNELGNGELNLKGLNDDSRGADSNQSDLISGNKCFVCWKLAEDNFVQLPCSCVIHIECLKDKYQLSLREAKTRIKNLICHKCKKIILFDFFANIDQLDPVAQKNAKLLMFSYTKFYCPDDKRYTKYSILSKKLTARDKKCNICKTIFCTFCGVKGGHRFFCDLLRGFKNNQVDLDQFISK